MGKWVSRLLIIGILVCHFSIIIKSQSVKLDWAKSILSSTKSSSSPRDVVTDGNNNVFVIGDFYGTVDFDPGIGIFNLTSNGAGDAFIQKLDSNGNFIWAKSWGGKKWDVNNSIALDHVGNIYIIGNFEDTVDFDPGVGQYLMNSFGSTDIFISKLNSNGNLLWATSQGGIRSDHGNSITIDDAGDVITTGNFYGNVDFDPSTTVYTLANTGRDDLFLQKLDSSRALIWVRSIGGQGGWAGSAYVSGKAVQTDSLNNIYLTGIYSKTIDFDPNINTNNLTSNGGHDVFVLKLDSSSNLLWVNSIGGKQNDFVKGLALDQDKNVCILGQFQDTVDFDPSNNSSFLYSPLGQTSTFIQKVNLNGKLSWAKRNGNVDGNSIKINAQKEIFISGIFENRSDFDPDTSSFYVNSNQGSTDIFLQKLDSNGRFEWVKTTGGKYSEFGGFNALDNSGNIITTGSFVDTVDFDPSSNILNLHSFQEINGLITSDVFIQKLNPCIITRSTDTVTACDSFKWIDSVTYFSGNSTAEYILTNTNGCDSIITLFLTIQNSTTGNDSIVACDKFKWIDGKTYTSNDTTSTILLKNNASCDSLVTLNLSINYSNTGNAVVNACNEFTWVDGITYKTGSNFHTYTFTNTGGCDSIVTLDLTINKVDVGISASDSSITANASLANYQWLDCNNNFSPIQGEINQVYEPDSTGSYAVEIFQNSCIDTSNCVNILKDDNVGLEEREILKNIFVYPNPTTENVKIMFPKKYSEVNIEVIDAQGKTRIKRNYLNVSDIELKIPNSEGIHLLIVKIGRDYKTFRIMVNAI